MPTLLDNGVAVSHDLILSMLDGKACNAIAGNASSQTCYICGATPKDMNDLNAVRKKHVNTTNYRLGLSSLHGWIKSMKYILHLSYNLKFKKWRVSTNEDKCTHEIEKRRIQDEFRSKTGLLIDIVKQGKGTSNDGNTARRFFQDHKLTSEITRIDFDVIRKFAVILQVISCGHKVDCVKFDEFADGLAKSCVTHGFTCLFQCTNC